MNDLNKALHDIATIRQHMTIEREFRGFGPITIAITAGLAIFTGLIQTFVPFLANSPWAYFSTWIITAIISTILVGFEMRSRCQRHHGGFADEMLFAAAGNFLPAGVVGAFLLIAFSIFAPDLLWLLPSLWLILVGLGFLASLRILPPTLNIGAATYIILGFLVFLLSSEGRALSPWMMAAPFAIGQIIMALLLHTAWEKRT